MVAIASRPDPLGRADAALDAALSNLFEALAAFRAAGRADLAGPIQAAVQVARQTEVLRRCAPGAPARTRDPADWFQD